MIVETEVKMVINQYNFDYYKNLGYDINKIGQRIMINVDDLPETSGIKIHTKCEYYGCIFEKAYRRYIEAKNSGKICCKKCIKYKIPENALRQYGTRSTLRIPEIHEKVVKNNLEKFGCENPLESSEIRAKGVETMQKKYGYKYTLQSDILRAKCNQTLYKNGENTTITSKQQLHICKLFFGELNYPIGIYHIDIMLPNNICCEYDGSGHSLCVKLKKMTLDEFEHKEEKRVKFLTDNNYKIFKLISTTDILPSDDILLSIKRRALQILEDDRYTYYEYHLDLNSESFK